MDSLHYLYGPCDMVLRTYDNSPDGFVSYEQLAEARRRSPVSDEEEVYSFLSDEGLLEQTGDGFQITRRGRIFINEGGFRGRLRRRRVERALLWVGTVCAAVAAVSGILSLLL